MRALSELEPKLVYEYFEDICAIPRSSGDEEAICNYLVDFAKSHDLEVVSDELYNVVIKKNAAPGYEDCEGVIMQAHTDMVCVADDGVDIDFAKDGITPYVDGDFIRAKGTTLGADDGMGVAFILAVLADDSIMHPSIEAVFTTREEVGLDGASHLDTSILKNKRMINLDTEEEVNIVIGCAGGARAHFVKSYDVVKKSGEKYMITASGVAGGHSGIEIDRGGANANVILGQILYRLAEKIDIGLVSAKGGLKDNAICVMASAEVVVPIDSKQIFEEIINDIDANIKIEYKNTDPTICASYKLEGEATKDVIKKEDLTTILTLYNSLPYGVQKMSQAIDGLVETSLNLGVMNISNGKASFSYGVRSNSSYEMKNLTDKLDMIAKVCGASVEYSGKYPAWENSGVSDFAKFAANLYQKMYGSKLEIITLHAGLECGLFYEKIAGLDAISIGPDIFDVHTTAEHVSIPSVNREWEFLLNILKAKVINE